MPVNYNQDPLNVMIDVVKDKAEKIRDARYFVKRGQLLLPNHNFDAHPYTWSILVDSGDLFNRGIGTQAIAISFEIGTSINPDVDNPGLDDGILQEFIQDGRQVLLELEQERNKVGDPVVFRIYRENSRFIQFHDGETRIQGIVVTTNVDI